MTDDKITEAIKSRMQRASAPRIGEDESPVRPRPTIPIQPSEEKDTQPTEEGISEPSVPEKRTQSAPLDEKVRDLWNAGQEMAEGHNKLVGRTKDVEAFLSPCLGTEGVTLQGILDYRQKRWKKALVFMGFYVFLALALAAYALAKATVA